MTVKPIPDGYHSVTPYLIAKNAANALVFYKKAFRAEELLRLDAPDGSVAHAEFKVGDSPVMLADENPDWDAKGPESLGGTPVSLMVYVDNVDELFANAIACGAKELRPVADQFYGDRTGTLVDPFGHVWSIATHKEDLSPEEMNERMAKMMSEGGPS